MSTAGALPTGAKSALGTINENGQPMVVDDYWQCAAG